MKTFKQFLSESEKNTHMYHLDELIFLEGVDGTRRAVNYLREFRNMLSIGHSANKVTTKFDGCVHEDTIVMTNLGAKKISDLGAATQVMGYDFDDSVSKMVDLLGETSKAGDKKWVEVCFGDYSIKLTEDHELYTTNRGWVAAGNLMIDDDIKEL